MWIVGLVFVVLGVIAYHFLAWLAIEKYSKNKARK